MTIRFVWIRYLEQDKTQFKFFSSEKQIQIFLKR